MRVALIKPPATYADWYRQPAMGIACVCASLRRAGFDCRIFDAYFHGWSQTRLIEHVQEYAPDVVGLTAMTHEIKDAAAIAQSIKQRLPITAVIGGCHATALPARTLEEFPDFDYAVQGEGEKTAAALVTAIADRQPSAVENIAGLAFRRNGQIFVNAPPPYMTGEELDALGFPAIDDYYAGAARPLAGPESYYVMFTSRGCPYKCAFCMQVLGRTVRRRSADSILNEMEYAIEKYAAHTFDFADEIFLFDNERTRQLLNSFIAHDFAHRIRWSALTRANFVNEELIALAARAGCFRLEMGVEAGDDDILKRIDKGITVDTVRRAAAIIKAAGISLGTYYILGHPGETLQTVKKTVQLAAELNTDSIAVGLMVPYPGTRIFELASQNRQGYRLLSTDWAQYDKYGGRVLEIDGLPYEQLVKWQRKALLLLYWKNRRFADCLRYFWKRRKAIMYMLHARLMRIAGLKRRHT